MAQIEARTKVEVAKAEAQARAAEAMAVAKAKVYEAQATHEMAWEMARAQDASKSWLDEFWSVILAWPLVAGFIPLAAVQESVKRGFANMEAAPEWYVASVGAALAFAFAIRKVANIMSKPRPVLPNVVRASDLTGDSSADNLNRRQRESQHQQGVTDGKRYPQQAGAD